MSMDRDDPEAVAMASRAAAASSGEAGPASLDKLEAAEEAYNRQHAGLTISTPVPS